MFSMKEKHITLRRFALFALLAISLGCGALLSSCTIEASDNGNLDGFWHLERIDTISSGGTEQVAEKLIFWSVNHNLLRLSGGSNAYLLRFRQTADSLVVYSPYLDGGHEDIKNGGDHPVTDVDVLSQYGIHKIEEHFVKEVLNGSHMVLRSAELRLYFTKF